MFCGKCGNEIKEGVQFCGKCGAPVEVKTQTAQLSVNSSGVKFDTMSMVYLAGAVLNLILIPLWFGSFIDAGITINGYSDSTAVSMHQMCKNGDAGFISIVMVVLFILSAAFLGFIAIEGTGAKPGKKMILPLVTAVITFLNAVVTYTSSKEQLIDELGEKRFSQLDFGLTFGGILSIIISGVLVVFGVGVMIAARKRR